MILFFLICKQNFPSEKMDRNYDDSNLLKKLVVTNLQYDKKNDVFLIKKKMYYSFIFVKILLPGLFRIQNIAQLKFSMP